MTAGKNSSFEVQNRISFLCDEPTELIKLSYART
jgi:hypothetical protein